MESPYLSCEPPIKQTAVQEAAHLDMDAFIL